MRAWTSLVVCLATFGCQSQPYLNEADLARDAKTVAHEPTFTLFSPYDAAATANHADSVRAEIELVRTLFADTDSTPVRLYLVPIAAEAGHEDELWRSPAKQGLKGMASEGDFAFIYTSANVASSSSLEHAGYMRGGTLRHELTHLYAHRAGLYRAPWFEEGLALEVESMGTRGSQLFTDPFPWLLLQARKHPMPGSLARALEWRREVEISDAERELRYIWSAALFRFLLEQRTEVGFAARARAVMNLGDAEIQKCEAAWLVWLLDLDALERIRRGAHSADENERAVSVGVMPNLAASGAAELLTRAADELALEMLADPACVNSAATFLLFFRADKLIDDDIARLSRSDDPGSILTAQALHAKRHEPVDRALAKSTWERVPALQRTDLYVAKFLIFGAGEP